MLLSDPVLQELRSVTNCRVRGLSCHLHCIVLLSERGGCRTHSSLLEASNFVETLEERQGLKISCPEEIAYRLGYIDAEKLESLAAQTVKSDYGKYLYDILQETPAVQDQQVDTFFSNPEKGDKSLTQRDPSPVNSISEKFPNDRRTHFLYVLDVGPTTNY